MDMYDIINSLLNQRDMNKKELAEKAGVPYSSLISAFNRRSESFSHSHLQKIAAALDVSVDEILDHASDERDRHKAEVYGLLEDIGFTLDFDEGYNLYGNVGITNFELGITDLMNEDDLIHLVDSIVADGEYFKDRYIKKRLTLELGWDEDYKSHSEPHVRHDDIVNETPLQRKKRR